MPSCRATRVTVRIEVGSRGRATRRVHLDERGVNVGYVDVGGVSLWTSLWLSTWLSAWASWCGPGVSLWLSTWLSAWASA